MVIYYVTREMEKKNNKKSENAKMDSSAGKN